MQEYSLGAIETRFAELIWKNEPVSSGRQVQLCQQELGWKKSTTYTVLRRLCDKGLFRNADGQVTALLNREAFYARQSKAFVETAFGGSLPGFLAAWGQAMIDAGLIDSGEPGTAGIYWRMGETPVLLHEAGNYLCTVDVDTGGCTAVKISN